MSLVERLSSLAPVFRGVGLNHEQEEFAAEMRIETLVNGSAVLLRYKATLLDGSVAHEECTLLGAGPDGNLCLWPVMSELPTVLPHMHQAATGAGAGRFTFASVLRGDLSCFREEITIELGEDGSLTYSHAWGMPGEAIAPRSSVCMLPVDV